ncbi:MAG: MerR family transcriptional regulator [Dehalococcoidia bacterium]|nr:MerR family transcriptional regulator [Dehalococcoidia bacterium]
MREPESRLRTEDEGRGEDRGKYVMSVAVGMTGVEAYRIRRYEEAGLLRPARSSGGRRLLSDEDICLVRDAAKLESEGVNLTGIKVILRMRRVDGVVPDEPRENGGG